MAKKRAARTERRAQERSDAKATKRLIHDRERLFELSEGGAAERPIRVASASVVDLRAESLPCPQCGGAYRVVHHRAVDGLRALEVQCQQCSVKRRLWFEIIAETLN